MSHVNRTYTRVSLSWSIAYDALDLFVLLKLQLFFIIATMEIIINLIVFIITSSLSSLSPSLCHLLCPQPGSMDSAFLYWACSFCNVLLVWSFGCVWHRISYILLAMLCLPPSMPLALSGHCPFVSCHTSWWQSCCHCHLLPRKIMTFWAENLVKTHTNDSRYTVIVSCRILWQLELGWRPCTSSLWSLSVWQLM